MLVHRVPEYTQIAAAPYIKAGLSARARAKKLVISMKPASWENGHGDMSGRTSGPGLLLKL